MNKRIKILKEGDVVNEMTLQQLLDMASKVQIAAIPLVDGCMKFNNQQLKSLSVRANDTLTDLANSIRNLTMDAGGEEANSKIPLEHGQEPEQGTEQQQQVPQQEESNMIEAVDPTISEESIETITESKKKSFNKSRAKAILENAISQLNELEDEESLPTYNKETDQYKSSKENAEMAEDNKTYASKEIDESFNDFKNEMVTELANCDNEELKELSEAVAKAEDIDSFNSIMEKVYDCADKNNILIEIA